MNKCDEIKILKGNIIFTENSDKFTIYKNSYLIINKGRVENIFTNLPEEYKDCHVEDFGDNLIIPGMNDMHCHAPQYKNLGIGMDKELMPWLQDYTFPEEAKFKDISYAKEIYCRFLKDIWKNGTTRIVLFASLHKEASKLLMDMFIKAGMGAYVGKVNMDINCPDYLSEDYQQSLFATEEILKDYENKSDLVKPIITPRFVPSCSIPLMTGLADLSQKYNVPVQSHLSENFGEIDLVKQLHPGSNFYGEVYDKYGLFGSKPTLMAHCVHCSHKEIELIKKNAVTVVHCPTSNFNVGSGLMPARKYLNEGINITLGTDMSGGHTPSLFKIIAYAIQVSKIKWMESGKKDAFLSNSEAFYMATKAGGSFFGKVGSFEKGYDFDALVIDDFNLYPEEYSLEQRLERFIYLGDDRNIIKRYVCGKEISEPIF
jgi:guanine deaminase